MVIIEIKVFDVVKTRKSVHIRLWMCEGMRNNVRLHKMENETNIEMNELEEWIVCMTKR